MAIRGRGELPGDLIEKPRVVISLSRCRSVVTEVVSEASNHYRSPVFILLGGVEVEPPQAIPLHDNMEPGDDGTLG